MKWTEFMGMMNDKAKESEKLIKKIALNPDSKNVSKWYEQVLKMGLYEQDEIDYLVNFYRG